MNIQQEQASPEVDSDTLALKAAREIAAIDRNALPGGDNQLTARIQCIVRNALTSYRPTAPVLRTWIAFTRDGSHIEMQLNQPTAEVLSEAPEWCVTRIASLSEATVAEINRQLCAFCVARMDNPKRAD